MAKCPGITLIEILLFLGDLILIALLSIIASILHCWNQFQAAAIRKPANAGCSFALFGCVTNTNCCGFIYTIPFIYKKRNIFEKYIQNIQISVTIFPQCLVSILIFRYISKQWMECYLGGAQWNFRLNYYGKNSLFGSKEYCQMSLARY